MGHVYEDHLSFNHEAVNKWVYILSAFAISGGLYLLNLHNYLLFHSLAELFSVVIAFGIFVIAWNSRGFSSNNYLLFLGIAFLFVGGIDLVHTIAYKGMGVFPQEGANLPTQLWIAARYLESIALLLAPWFLRRRLNAGYAFAGYALVFAILMGSIFSNIFPVCYVDGVGITPFKTISEYVICLILAAGLFYLFVHKRDFDLRVLWLLIISIVFMIFSELAFTAYIGVYDGANMAGHLLKIFSFYLIYRALIKTGFVEPYNLIFRDLKRNEESLQRAQRELEARVEERTEELAKSQQRLQQLASQLLLTQEKERKRVAIELHDGLLSELAATKYLLEGKIMLMEKGKLSDPGELKRVVEILATAMKEARRIMNNLHPAILDELGLSAAINWLCGEYQRSYPHIKVQKQLGITKEDILGGVGVAIFRVLQEALNNFAKHGKGNLVDLSLSRTNGIFALMIRDNGQGFDLENAAKGLGLESMRERVELSGGKFQIESIIGQGTIIRASWKSS